MNKVSISMESSHPRAVKSRATHEPAASSWVVKSRPSVTAYSPTEKGVRKPSDPRLNETIGGIAKGKREEAKIIVPSPPRQTIKSIGAATPVEPQIIFHLKITLNLWSMQSNSTMKRIIKKNSPDERFSCPGVLLSNGFPPDADDAVGEPNSSLTATRLRRVPESLRVIETARSVRLRELASKRSKRRASSELDSASASSSWT